MHKITTEREIRRVRSKGPEQSKPLPQIGEGLTRLQNDVVQQNDDTRVRSEPAMLIPGTRKLSMLYSDNRKF